MDPITRGHNSTRTIHVFAKRVLFVMDVSIMEAGAAIIPCDYESITLTLSAKYEYFKHRTIRACEK